MLFDSSYLRGTGKACRAVSKECSRNQGLGFGSPVVTAFLGDIWSDLGVLLLEIRSSGSLDVCRTLTGMLKWRF